MCWVTNGTDYSGYTASPSRAECPSGYKWIQIAIDPDVLGGVTTGGAMTDGTWMVEFKLKVSNNAHVGDEGIVYMSEDWVRTEDNNNGLMFYGWLNNRTDKVWTSYNNKVNPDLSLATDTVTAKSFFPVRNITGIPEISGSDFIIS